MLSEAHPLIRRIIRFVALPYCFFKYINWEICKVDKIRVIKDLLYIFFKLKYFPENYSKCRLWEKPRRKWSQYYGSVYDCWQRHRLRKEVFPFKYRIIFDDKNICYQLCRANNLPVPKSYGTVNKENILCTCLEIINSGNSKRLILKPIEGRGGKGILMAKKQDDSLLFINSKGQLENYQYISNQEYVIQEFIEQHDDLSLISESINTIRIVTMLTKNSEVIYLGARMRFGIGNKFLDNTSQGGIAVGIDMNSGSLNKFAFDSKGKIYTQHPDSKKVFYSTKVPHWHEVLALAKNAQVNFSYNKIIGQDIAIKNSGPVIIELNAEYDNVMFEQACGPILEKERTRKEFKRYNLLFNNYQ